MFNPGAISQVSFKNFVTYEEGTICPGPRLNMLIGPNGTGKSTVVAAIILGLGGNPKIVGRGSSLFFEQNLSALFKLSPKLFRYQNTSKRLFVAIFEPQAEHWSFEAKNQCSAYILRRAALYSGFYLLAPMIVRLQNVEQSVYIGTWKIIEKYYLPAEIKQ